MLHASIDKDFYRELCDQHSSLVPLFHQAWWLQAVCGEDWQAIICQDGERTAGVWPLHVRRKYGLRCALMPQLTPYGGPIYFPPDGLSSARLPDFENKVVQAMMPCIDSLRLHLSILKLSPAISNWLPFYWQGFQQTTRYTYRIADIRNPEQVLNNFDRSKQRARTIRQAEPHYQLVDNLTATQFATMHHRYWQSQGEADLLSLDLIERVVESATARHQGLLLGLRNAEGQVVVAWFVVYDSRCAYALLSARSEAHTARDKDATALLIWKFLQRLAPLTQVFDFEGSMEPGAEYYYRSFGAVQTPVMQLTRCSNALLRAALTFRRT